VLLTIVKLVVLITYACFGVFLVGMACRSSRPEVHIPRRALTVLFAAIAGLVFIRFSLSGLVFPLSVIGAAVLFAIWNRAWKSPQLLIAGFAVVTAGASLAWWLGPGSQPQAWRRAVAFILIAGLIQAGLGHRDGKPAAPPGPLKNHFIFLAVPFTIGGILLLADMTAFRPGTDALALLAHHQGAFIGSALHVRAGLVPFYDVPLQYGLGPTMTIAFACGIVDCWSGVHFLTVASSVLMGLLILRMALSRQPSRGLPWRLAAMLVVFASVFLWPGYRDLGLTSVAAPSISGMRFLPVTLVAFFLFFDRPRMAAAALVPAVLWSPEAGVMSIAVFGVHETARLGFLAAARNTFVIAAGSVSGFVLIHRLIYGVWVQPDVVAEYILHVPGPLPVDPFSDVIFLALALALAAWTVCRREASSAEFRRSLVVATLLFASASYYLGRSHPNNICNLMPFVALVALCAMDSHRALSGLTAIGLAASVAAGVLSLWLYVPFDYRETRPAMPLTAAIAALDPEMNEIRAGIANPDHLGIADIGIPMNRHPAETVIWTPIDPFSLWGYVPSERRKLYIIRSAEAAPERVGDPGGRWRRTAQRIPRGVQRH